MVKPQYDALCGTVKKDCYEQQNVRELQGDFVSLDVIRKKIRWLVPKFNDRHKDVKHSFTRDKRLNSKSCR